MNLLPRLLFSTAKVALVLAVSVPAFSASSANTSAAEAEQAPPQIQHAETTRTVKVLVRVYVDVDGRQLQREVSQSSGSPKIDKEALARVATWNFVPAGRGNLPEPMWHVVPITFTLK